jgi:large subunit ribosomal protein L18
MKQTTGKSRLRRKLRVRSKLKSTTERPRLSVFRSSKHIYAQIIDDQKKVTIVQANDSEIKQGKTTNESKLSKQDIAAKVGALIVKKAKEAKIKKVLFDRGSYKYHGRIKSFAEEARNSDLIF